MTRILLAALSLTVGVMAAPAFAQSTSSKPITLVVTFPPGGNNDLTARIVAPLLGEALHRNVIVDNRAGAGGVVGTTYVAHARPDGDTLLLGTANLSYAPFVYKDVPYDPAKDFIPIGGIQSVPLVVTASKASGITTWAQLVKLAAEKKGLSAASAGNGTSNHVSLERIRMATGLPLTHIPYKGSGPAISDLMAGQVDIMVDQLNSSLQQIRAGKIVPVVQLGATRAPQLPDVPTLAEAGVKDLTALTWAGLFVPAGTPPAVVDALDKALHAALATPAAAARFDEMGVARMQMTRAQFTEFVKAELAANKATIAKANIRSD